jgi:hypothetical protein
MAKFRGMIRHNALEGGHFQLVADDGTVYEVEGSDPMLRRAGAQVEITGSVDRTALSLAMTGARLKVKSVKTA